MLLKESEWSAIRVNFWLLQILQGFLIALYWMKCCTAKAGIVDVAEPAASQVVLLLSAKT